MSTLIVAKTVIHNYGVDYCIDFVFILKYGNFSNDRLLYLNYVCVCENVRERASYNYYGSPENGNNETFNKNVWLDL